MSKIGKLYILINSCFSQFSDEVQPTYLIFDRAGVYKDSLKTWNARNQATQTYNDMITFFRDKHTDLEMVGALKIKVSTLNQANMLQSLQK